MRRIQRSYMFKSDEEANAYADSVMSRGPADPYQPKCFVAFSDDLPAPYTHTVTVERWNSCD